MGRAKLLDGKKLAEEFRSKLKVRIENELTGAGHRPPCLKVILVGDNPASQAYVRGKERAASGCSIESETLRLPTETSAAELEKLIDKLNADPETDGILLQLPLPEGLDERPLLDRIDPKKDVDGLHPLNQGLVQRGSGTLIPCTPLGCMKILESYYGEPSLSGKRAIVIGRSVLVGKPVAALMLNQHATVTIAHSRTPNLPDLAREADILVAAVGRPELVRGDWVRPGAVVIDVGINRGDDGKLIGDVTFDEVVEVASAITPVPGGVGPMTVAMLLENTFQAARTYRS